MKWLFKKKNSLQHRETDCLNRIKELEYEKQLHVQQAQEIQSRLNVILDMEKKVILLKQNDPDNLLQQPLSKLLVEKEQLVKQLTNMVYRHNTINVTFHKAQEELQLLRR